MQSQPQPRGEESPGFVEAFGCLLENADAEELVASGAKIQALLDEYIGRADTSERTDEIRR